MLWLLPTVRAAAARWPRPQKSENTPHTYKAQSIPGQTISFALTQDEGYVALLDEVPGQLAAFVAIDCLRTQPRAMMEDRPDENSRSCARRKSLLSPSLSLSLSLTHTRALFLVL